MDNLYMATVVGAGQLASKELVNKDPRRREVDGVHQDGAREARRLREPVELPSPKTT